MTSELKLTAALALPLLVSSCSTTARNVVAGLGVGGAFAAGLEAMGVEHGAEIGAFLGLATIAVGEAVREDLEAKRDMHQNESDFLDAEIANAKSEISDQESKISQTSAEISRYRSQVVALEGPASRDASVEAQAKASLVEVRATVARLEKQEKHAQKRVDYFNAALKTSIEREDEVAEEAELLARRKELLAKRDAHIAQYEKLQGQLEETIALEQRLADLGEGGRS